jgi:hypothetical protein
MEGEESISSTTHGERKREHGQEDEHCILHFAINRVVTGMVCKPIEWFDKGSPIEWSKGSSPNEFYNE